jgi:hypothetical protein
LVINLVARLSELIFEDNWYQNGASLPSNKPNDKNDLQSHNVNYVISKEFIVLSTTFHNRVFKLILNKERRKWSIRKSIV